jgi:hypothetical protein
VAAALDAARSAVDAASRFPFRDPADREHDDAISHSDASGDDHAISDGDASGDGGADRGGDAVGGSRGDGSGSVDGDARRVGDRDGSDRDRTAGAAGVELHLEVDDLPPGPELARLITTIDPTSVSDETLVDLVAAAERLGAWARACSAALAAELSQRPAMRTSVFQPRTPLAPVESTATELSMRLGWSPVTAARLTRMGRALTGPLLATGTAFANGRIDTPRAQAITTALDDVPTPIAWAVEDQVLPGAGSRSVSKVRAHVHRALITVDPAEAVARARHARTTRRVEAPRIAPDGMATLTAVLPAPQATGIYRVLDAAARTARAAGDPRTLDQLRADGLCDLTLGDDPAIGHTDLPDPTTGDDATGTTCDDPTGTTCGAPTGTTAAAPDDAAPAPRPTPRRPTVLTRVTMPLSTLLGVDDQPADLEGYGAIDPVTARALAAGGVFQRMVTDPLSGTLLDLGRTTYRPSTALTEHVQARDGTCRHPACSVPATSCDLDHTRDYHREPDDGGPPGTTSHDNLGPLCRRHHRMKTEAGFRLRQSAPGRFEWLTPTGHHYAVPEHLLAPPPEPPPPPDRFPGDPPF